MSKTSCLAVAFGILLASLAGISCGHGDRPASTVASSEASPETSPTALPFGPTAMPISQGDALWEWIADNSLECEPILQITYLPSKLSRVSLDFADQQRGCVLFGIASSDGTGNARLLVGRRLAPRLRGVLDLGPWLLEGGAAEGGGRPATSDAVGEQQEPRATRNPGF